MNSGDHTFDVAIIGAGFSGTMVAVHLAGTELERRILLVDSEGAFARGVAYGTQFRRHLLNVPAAKMSAFPDLPDHFSRWLETHAEELWNFGVAEISGGTFLPRQVYGSYLRDILNETQKHSPGLQLIEEEIVDIEPHGDGLILHAAYGAQYSCARAVLALGNFPPGDPHTRERGFHYSPRYINTPWAAESLRRISENGDVLILGSGLTALDLLLTLEQSKTRGTIHVLSRHGFFPQPHRRFEPHPEWFDSTEFPVSTRALVRLVRNELRRAIAQGLDWRVVIDALRPHTQRIWQRLPVPERRKFIRHVRSFWEPHRHRAASEVLAVNYAMMTRRQVISHKGRLVAIEESPAGLNVSFISNGAGSKSMIEVAHVVNCTGPECNYQKLKQPLIVNLFARGLIHPDPLYQGLMASPDGEVINYLGQISSNIFTLGSPMKGMLFETTAVPELRVQARNLAQKLLSNRGPGKGNTPPSLQDKSTAS